MRDPIPSSTTDTPLSQASPLPPSQVLPPLQVLDILSRSASMPLLVVRDYVSRLLREAYADVHASQNKIHSLRQSTQEMRAEVDSLRSTARVFQATKCHGCPRALEVPAVHFLCMHSYHQVSRPEPLSRSLNSPNPAELA